MALPEILLVDDNLDRAQQVETVLRFLEYKVIAVTGNQYESDRKSVV